MCGFTALRRVAASTAVAREGKSCASAAVLRARRVQQRVSLPFEGHGPGGVSCRDSSTPRVWLAREVHDIRHSDRHAPGRTQERHLRSKIR